MTPRPLSESDRREVEAYIARVWPACCAEVGLRNRTQPWFSESGTIGGAPGHAVDEGGARALEALACDLESDLCLCIEREPGQPPRVLGWATWEPPYYDPVTQRGRGGHTKAARAAKEAMCNA